MALLLANPLWQQLLNPAVYEGNKATQDHNQSTCALDSMNEYIHGMFHG